ncbi:hypothetical protein BB559_000063 [Furculomyces boomerangus]|uniref:Uncharacterized protein n=2 Tax=Harpellales TaxID=61421 RepID=A0A2T9Z6D5_9FUNG|nr:hypothetical protein BB559_000063 [Furculomyces boomerangus]PVZ98958.1 hypothetical protein BB558_005038 [Smittium angustum]
MNAKEFVFGFLRGIGYAFIGIIYILRNPEKLKKVGTLALQVIAMHAALKLFLTLGLYIILQVGYFMGSLFFLRLDISSSQISDLYNDSFEHVNMFLETFHFFVMEMLSRVYEQPFESAFFETMDIFDPVYSKSVSNRKSTKSSFKELVFLVQYGVKRFIIYTLTFYAVLIPFIGVLFVPISSLIITYNIYGYTLSILVSLLFLILPSTDSYRFPYLQYILNIREFSLNLLRPYYRRSTLDEKKQEALYTDNAVTILGFGTVFYLLGQIRFAGPGLYIFGQASISYLVAKYAQEKEVLSKLETKKL